MVKFGSYTLPNTGNVERGKELVIVKKGTPGYTIAVVERAGGRNRSFGVAGHMTYSGALPTDPGALFDLKDGTTRTLDLEDGSDTIEAVIKQIRFSRDVYHPKHVFYAVVFLEIDNPS